jgi:sugar diacid utilization regulator
MRSMLIGQKLSFMYNVNEEICLISGKPSKREYTLKLMWAKLRSHQLKSSFLKTLQSTFRNNNIFGNIDK